MRKYLVPFLLMQLPAATALGGDRLEIRAGYNLRTGPSLSSRIVRTARSAIAVVTTKQKGQWRQVCTPADKGRCTKNSTYWVHRSALITSKAIPVPSPRPTSSSLDRSETAADTCTNCSRARAKGVAGQAAQLAAAARAAEPHGYTLPRGFDRACSTFITKKGLGDWGRTVVNAAKRIAPNCFYNRNLFGRLCPNYRSLSQTQKDAMVALVFASIAQTESTCNPRARAPGVNDIADGMFQLEYSADQRRRAGRNQRWCATNRPVDSRSQQFQTECSVSIVEDTVCDWGSYIFDSAGYWQKLRNNREIARRIQTTAKNWGLCQ